MKRDRAFWRHYKLGDSLIIYQNLEHGVYIVRENPTLSCDFFKYILYAKAKKQKTIRVQDCWDEHNISNLLLVYENDIITRYANENSKQTSMHF